MDEDLGETLGFNVKGRRMSSDNPIKSVIQEELGKIYTHAACGFYRMENNFHLEGVSPNLPCTTFKPALHQDMSWLGYKAQRLSKKWDNLEWESQSSVVFDLASLTKALFTAPKIFQLACEKGLSFYQPLESFLEKELKDLLSPELRQLTLSSLLGHRSGLPAWANFWVECESHQFSSSRERLLFHLNRMSKAINPERGMVYSDLGYLLLGLIIESESKKSLQACLADWNRHSGAALSFSRFNEPSAGTGYCPWRQRELNAEVHDENCFSLGGACGHAGLFGNLHDVSLHLKWLFSTGFGRAFLHHNALLRKTDHVKGDGLLGLRQGLAAHAQPFAKGMAMGHLGFTGTSFWVDPESFSFYILLTNRVAMGRLSKGIMDVRAKVANLADSYFHS